LTVKRSFIRVFKFSILLIFSPLINLVFAEESESSGLSVSQNIDRKLNVKFSSAEIRYITKKTSLKVCIDPDWMPFEKNDHGTYVGLTADYVSLFERILGIPIILVPTKTWNESLVYAKTHKCDFISAIGQSAEKSEYLNFSQSYFKSPIVIATDIHKPWVSELSLLEGKKLGVVQGYAIADFIKETYPKLILVEVESIDSGLKKVAEGELYGYVGTLATVGYNIQKHYFGSLKIGSKLEGSWGLNVGIRKDEPLLTEIMNKIVSAIPMNEHQRILNNWLSVSIAHENPNELTQAEKQFLKTHPIIRFRTRPNRPPFEYDNQGVAEGIAVDYIKTIAQLTGFTPKFVFDDSSADHSHDELDSDSGRFDTLLYSVKNEERSLRFNYGDIFLSYPVMVIVNKETFFVNNINDLNGKIVAMEKGFVTTNWVKNDYPEINITEVTNTAEALYMVENKQVDAYIGNLVIANYMIGYGLLKNVKVGVPTKYKNIDFRFITPKNWPELVSILNKGFRALSSSQHSTIQQKWYTLRTIEKQNYTLVSLVLFAATIIFIWFYWSNNRLSVAKSRADEALKQLKIVQQALKSKNKELERLSITDKLTGIYNRVKLESTLSSELDRAERYSENFSVIMVDLDHFKRVNDTLGHQAGDRVLNDVAQLFKRNIRKVDTVGRWGGEEFFVICPHCSIVDATKFAEHLREHVQSYDFGEIGVITASFGVTTYQKGDSSIELLSRSDEALYRSKESGRNKVTSYY